ncbi:MAG TPA: FAD-dependent oxidoreductase, partial [Dongiaceae bacterium]|nr:FAD-dependent oxidoreductase [Dongiaceae bacterium]
MAQTPESHKSGSSALADTGEWTLGIPGFSYADLHDPRRLADLSQVFDRALAAADPELAHAFAAYRAAPDATTVIERSRLLVGVGAQLGDFLARLFGVESARQPLVAHASSEAPIFAFKRDFVQRRVARRYPHGKAPETSFADLDARVAPYLKTLFPRFDWTGDPEWATAHAVMALMNAADALVLLVREQRTTDLPAPVAATLADLRAGLQAPPAPVPAALSGDPAGDLATLEALLILIEDWLGARLADPAARAAVASWVSLHSPESIDYQHLVEVEHPDPALPSLMMGPTARRRRRDGFKLTDRRMSARETLDQAYYCVLCHERDKDSCSKGIKDKQGAVKKNPLGISLDGCPLDEKISEAHMLKRRGDAIAALAVICVDNPMCPGTGHRICNDCMKGCIYQKQEPVNIPQIETGILTDVLGLPWGFEIWDLLTRWNPLNVRRPHALPYNGRNVLVVGLGPAGYSLAHYLVNEGFSVVGIDGLKIEAPPDDLTGAGGRAPRPVRDVAELTRELDDRPLAGFGGVSEYGITVRWDKNFLTLIHLNLARRRLARFYGGVRFGGTLTVEQAWDAGFDHVAIAAGAGKPTIIDMKNNVIRGVRKASDFLMALQLTGAFRRDTLANLEARLPAIIVGGGLTAIDSATELLAYYPVQVEKTLERYETVVRTSGEEAALRPYTPEERERLAVYLEHGRACRAERERAARDGGAPDFAALVNRWGGVSIAYRKGMVDSPAYRLNHEEIIKALEEGIRFIEGIDPEEAVADRYGALERVIFRRLTTGEGGRWEDRGEKVTLEAKTLLVAAGTSPNVTYERERPGTFAMDDRRQFFRAHKAEIGADGRAVAVPAGRGEPAFFTSYAKEGRLVSYFGDNHPQYAGNVVKAMASARDGYPYLAALFESDLARLEPREQPARDAALGAFFRRLDDALRAKVVEVRRLTPTIVEAIVRAPLAARNFEPGQFFRLQNFERTAPRREGHPLLIEPLALTGAWVDRERGLLSLIALEMGTSSRLLSALKEGEEVVVMGPTGAPTE